MTKNNKWLLTPGSDVWVDSPPMLNRYLTGLEIIENWLHGTVVAITKKHRIIVIPHGEGIAEAHLTETHKINGKPLFCAIGGYNTATGNDSLSASEFIAIARHAITNRNNMLHWENKS